MTFPSFLKPTGTHDLIRVGSSSDGGYILPERIFSKISGIMSMGLFDDWSFEKDARTRARDIPVAVFDHTVTGKFWVRRIAANVIKGILKLDINRLKRSAQYFRYRRFFAQDNCVHHLYGIGKQDKMLTLQQAMEMAGMQKELLLKVDIESYEFDIIDEIIKLQDRFVAIAIELHLIDKYSSETKYFVESLSQKFALVHFHANNYDSAKGTSFSPIIELSFMNREYILSDEELSYRALPIEALDSPSVPNNPDIIPVFE